MQRCLGRWSAGILTFTLLTACAPAASAAGFDNDDCFACHDDDALVMTSGARVVSLYMPTNLLSGSVHDGLDCVDCHAGIKDLPHAKSLPPATCGGCHDDIALEYAASIHGVSQNMGTSGAARCVDCHGSHKIVPVKQANSPVFKLNLSRTCARCHSNPGLTAEYRMKYPEAASQYVESIHGRALLERGLIVAPSCNDCHGVHNIKRIVDRDSWISHANIPKTCGKCHVGIEETYNASVHGQLLLKGDKLGPVCTDCHTAHTIERPEEGHFKATSDRSCGRCHQEELEGYRETYHGKAMALGRPNQAPTVAACYDCHGAHNILPAADPRSTLSEANIVDTCRQCHPKANMRFTQFIAHANPLDGERYPLLHLVFLLMTGLLLGVFAFFGIHTALWLVRSGYVYRHDSKTFREAKTRAKTDEEWFTRFTPSERFLHYLVVTSFLLLVVTGMPLKFYYTNWAKTLFHLMGGPQVARSLHHFGALITFFYFGLHILEQAGIMWQDRARYRNPETGRLEFKRIWEHLSGPDSMMPHKRDWDDFVAHQKWFFGKGPRPQFDRWTYWEKFDYLAVFWGVAMIGVSGVILWFPVFFTRFLPGWVINLALIIHSDEALLAAGFIFTFHFFNVHFRVEKFPMDTVIFSGRISKAEMLHERKRWYDRLVAEDRLDQARVRDEWSRWKRIATAAGYTFFGIGVLLLILIAMAMGSRLLH